MCGSCVTQKQHRLLKISLIFIFLQPWAMSPFCSLWYLHLGMNPLGVSWCLSMWGLQYGSAHPGLWRAPKWLPYLPFLPFVHLFANEQSDNLSTCSTTVGTELLDTKRSSKPSHTSHDILLKMAQAGLTSVTSLSCCSPFGFLSTGPQQLFPVLSSPSAGKDAGCSLQSSCGLIKAFKS